MTDKGATAPQPGRSNGSNPRFTNAPNTPCRVASRALGAAVFGLRPAPNLSAFIQGSDSPAWPMMVTFRDMGDPLSVERVDPENLAATFGEGYALRRITVQLTKDSVTIGIGKWLRWRGSYPEPRLDADYRGSADPQIHELLSHGDFRRGTGNE